MANLDLNKLFVSVPQERVESFLKKYYTGTPNTAAEGEASNAVARLENYDSKIVFLGTSGQIFTQGKLYGGSASEIATLVADVAKLNGADTLEGSVAYAVKAAKTAVLGSVNSINTVDSVAGRVAALETLVGDNAADADTVINKLQEVYNWFAEVAETETGKALIDSVSANTTAIGKKATGDGTGENAATGLYKYVDDAVKSANSSTDDAIKALDITGNVSDEVAGIKVQIDEVDGKVQKPVVTVTGGSVVEGNTSVVTGGTVHSAIKNVIESLDVTETTVKNDVENEIVSFKYSETDGKVTISDLNVVTKTLGSVGLTKATEGENAGKWVAGSASDDKGLATAADVAAEIVADEEVIATALNDHETRISANEAKLEGITTTVLDAIEAAEHSKTTVLTGDTNGTVKVDGTDIAVKGLGSAAYTDSTAYDVSGAAAAVQGSTTSTVASVELRVKTIEDMEIWEVYTED